MGTFLKRAGFGVFSVTLPPKQWQHYLPDELYQKTGPQSPEGGGWEKVLFKEGTTECGEKRITFYPNAGYPNNFKGETN